MSIPIHASFETLSLASTQPTCPITLEPFIRPWILLEDGFTYEKSAIEEWLASHPNKSPMIGEIPSATLLPNCTIKNNRSKCSITKEPFREPYYCVQDGHTYEKDAIVKWIQTKIEEYLEQEIELPMIIVRSPISGVPLNKWTLVPNKILFKDNISQAQYLTLEIDLDKVICESAKRKNQEFLCIFDSEIRNLIENYNYENATEELKKINDRRSHLGLNTQETVSNHIFDLSHLNLSNMNLTNLLQKGTIIHETDLSDSVFNKCSFSNCRFINCNMQRAFFINCNFRGENTFFYKSNMKDAIFEEHCFLEKNNTQKRITNWEDFQAELSSRGATNVDSVSLRKL